MAFASADSIRHEFKTFEKILPKSKTLICHEPCTLLKITNDAVFFRHTVSKTISLYYKVRADSLSLTHTACDFACPYVMYVCIVNE